ncbi:MAG: HlyD family efflux transporter periplasmic adaptor subunit [Chlamydiae bacterium]|nr:HlyD family efflux transporter periplasmic adaptor subunit [Chlamydiota bacterium]
MDEEIKTKKPATPPRKKRQAILWVITICFLTAGIALFLFWWFDWRFEVSTKDSYVGGNQLMITSQISGFVQSLYADDNEIVREGQIIVELDPTDKKIAFEESKNHLALTVRHVLSLYQRVGELKSEKEKMKSEMIKKGQDYIHRKKLIDAGAVSKEDFEHAEADLISALASVLMVEHQLKAALSQVENTTVETHPKVLKAGEMVRKAWVDLKRCELVSPADGMVAKRTVQVGQSINPNDPLMIVVPFDQMWVDANFKEVQLKNVRIGQPATIKADMYGRKVIFIGKVTGIAAGTGSVFSLLPPQNATGNWIKIVQRLPVRIGLNPQETKVHPLRLGLSMDVTIDIRDIEKTILPEPTAEKPIYETDIFAKQEIGAQEIIQEIIKQNSTFSFLTDDEEEDEDG